MRPILACSVAFAALIWMPASWALGLGDVELRSALNQPLDARIELVSPREGELDQLRVSLASPEHFERYGLERTALHSRLRFELVREGRDAYIHLTTREPVRDPFVSFLVEARWASGRLLREYTLLLDPPDFGPGEAEERPAQPVAEREPEQRRPAREQERPRVEPTEPRPEEVTPRRAEPERAAPRLGGRYGPVQRNQALWNIASELRPSGVSINQMMIALFEANPGAFDGNINRLRQGAVLRVPERAELDQISVSAANRETARHHEEWQQPRTRVAEAPERERRDELRLVAPGDEDAEAAVGVGTDEADTRIAELETELDRVRDEREQAADESDALQGRVGELESEIEELRRMLELKDEQLATLQQRVRDDDLVAGLEEEPVFVDEEDEAFVEEEEALVEAEDEPAERDDEEVVAAIDDADPAAEAEVGEEPVEPEPTRTEATETTAPSMLSRISGLLATPVGMGILGALALAAILGLVAVRRRQAKPAATDSDVDIEPLDEDGDDFDAGDVEDVNLSDDLDEESDADRGAEKAASGDDVNVEELLEEADFHVAYGTYDKATGMLESALEKHPQDGRLHVKLAEALSAAGNADAFVAAAGRARDAVGEDSSEWAEISRMGRDIAPNNAMFAAAAGAAAGSAQATEDDLTPPEGGTLSDGMLHASDMDEPIDLDLGGDEGGSDAGDEVTFDFKDDKDDESGEDTISFDLPDAEAAGGESEEIPAPSGEEDAYSLDTSSDDDADLDFGLDDDSASVLDKAAESDHSTEEDSEQDDFPTVDVPPEKAEEAFGTDSQAQFEKAFEELSAYVGKDDGDGDSAEEKYDWKRDEPGTTTEDAASPAGIDFGDDDDDLLDLGDDDSDEMGEIDTKVDLARAYIDMGDSDGARGILEEVVEEGNEEQKKEARSLLESI